MSPCDDPSTTASCPSESMKRIDCGRIAVVPGASGMVSGTNEPRSENCQFSSRGVVVKLGGSTSGGGVPVVVPRQVTYEKSGLRIATGLLRPGAWAPLVQSGGRG